MLKRQTIKILPAYILIAVLCAACGHFDKHDADKPLIDTRLNPEDTIVVIYNHSTRNPRKKERCNASYNRVPPSLQELQDDRLLIYFLCSKATEGEDRSQAGNQVYARMYEIEQTLDRLIEQGVLPGHVFLAGHSKGAWASLMLMEQLDKKFNAAIVFAPALANRRSLQTYPWWRKEIRPKQIRQMLSAGVMDALVFAYEDDEYNRPRDLAFLTQAFPDTVKMISYRCDYEYTHNTHLHDCRKPQTKSLIAEYIQGQIKQWHAQNP